MPSGCDYFSAARQGSKVFLPAHCVQKEVVCEDNGDGQKDNRVTVQSHDKLHNDLTQQPSNSNDLNSTSGKPLAKNYSSNHHSDDFGELDMYVIICVVLLDLP